jgi:hypothetical protein
MPPLRKLGAITREITDCFEPVLLSKAFGEPGRPGEFRLIYDIASRFITAYEKLIDWGESTRAAQVPRQAHHLYQILSELADRPMRDVEEYVNVLVADLNDAVHVAALGEQHPVVLKFVCKITADKGLLEEVLREAERVHLAS